MLISRVVLVPAFSRIVLLNFGERCCVGNLACECQRYVGKCRCDKPVFQQCFLASLLTTRGGLYLRICTIYEAVQSI